MLLTRALLTIKHIPPVIITIINPLISAVSYLFNNPRAVGMLSDIIHTCPELIHILFVISDIICTVVCLPELVDMINRVITTVLIVGTRCWLLPTQSSANENWGQPYYRLDILAYTKLRLKLISDIKNGFSFAYSFDICAKI